MRYLKQRDEFVKNSLINEEYEAGSGPLANDIPWGDSLLGRLINSVIRKAKIGIDLVKMDSVIERLKESFDTLLSNAIIKGAEMDKDMTLKIDKYLLSAIIGVFRDAVEDKNTSKDEVIKATNSAIESVKDLQLSKESEKDRKELIDKLNEFLKSIEEKGEEKTESPKTDLMVSNLSHLSNIMKSLGSEKPVEKTKETFDRNRISIGQFYIANIDSKNKLVKVNSIEGDNAKVGIFENGKPTSIIKDIPLKSIFKEVRYEISPSQDGKRDTIVFNQEDTKLAHTSVIKLEVAKGSIKPKSTNESILFESNEGQTNLAKEKLKKSSDLLVKNDKGISINPEFINALIKQFKENPNDKGKDGVLNSPSYILTNLYKEIYSCLKGDRAGTIPDIGKLTESVDILRRDRTKIAATGEIIARFAKRTSQFEENEMYKSLGELGNEVHSFNTTLKEIFAEGMDVPDYRKEAKKESILRRYKEFISINEAEVEVGKPVEEKPKVRESDFQFSYGKIFNNDYLKRWILTDEEVRSIQKEVESVKKDSAKIVIDGIDPIIEIVKIFNRAYKLHTTNVIPSGRSGGRVSNKTFREYSFMGEGDGGSPTNPSTGAWRNNALFDKWESAVQDIIKDSKYQVIFNEDTVIKVGSADPRINVSKVTSEEGFNTKKKQGGGKTLLTFMNAMLDGSKLYKSGAQSAFIKEYFDVEVPSDILGFKSKGKNDTDKNAAVAEKAVKDTGRKKYSFKPIKDISPDFLRNFYAVKSGEKKYYMYLTDKDENYIYVKYSESFAPIDKYSSGVADISKGDMETIQMRDRRERDNSKFEVFYARIAKKKFPIKPGDTLEMKALNLEKYDLADNKDTVVSEVSKWDRIEKVYGVLSEDNKLFTLPEDKAKKVSSKDDKYKEKLQ